MTIIKDREIAKRRQQVYHMVISGVSQPKIAEQLGVTTRTIDNDLYAIRQKYKEEWLKRDREEILATLSEFARLRISKAMTIMTDPSSTKDQILKAIKSLQEEEALEIKRFTKAGIMPNDATVEIYNQTQPQVKIEIVRPDPLKDKVIDIPKEDPEDPEDPEEEA